MQPIEDIGVHYLIDTSKTLDDSGNAKLYRATPLHTAARSCVALKCISVASKHWPFGDGTSEPAVHEIAIHSRISALLDAERAIVPFVEAFGTRHKVYIAMELLSKGSLYRFLHNNFESSGLQNHESGLAEILNDMLFCIAFIHRHGFAHRDIKPDNFLIADDGTLRLCDFGFTSEENDAELSSAQCGTLDYMAPEVFSSTPVNNQKSDICTE